MFRFIGESLRALKGMFVRITLKSRIDDELYQAQVDLLNADHNAEHWVSHSEMLRLRVERLKDMRNAADETVAFNFRISTKSLTDALEKHAKDYTRTSLVIPEGFTQHEGGKNPVPGTKVLLVYRKDIGTPNRTATFSDGMDWHWNEMDLSENDIIAYKVV